MFSIPPGFGHPEQRGASAIVGLVLLFGMVIVGAGLILVASMAVTDSVQQQSQMNSAELSLEEASVELRTLSLRETDDVTSFGLTGKDDVSIEQNGRLRFELNGHSACRATMPLGSIVYRNDDGESVAYQAGGVWRESESGTTVVSSPDLTYRTTTIDDRTIRTIDFPVVNVRGSIDSGSNEVTARRVGDGESFERDLCLPVSENDTIDRVRTMTITVENSTYYEAWERYLDDEFGEAVIAKRVDDSADTLSYTVPLGQGLSPDEFTIQNAQLLGGFYAGSSSGEVHLKQNGLVDSYDGSEGPYDTQPENWGEGDLFTNGEVNVTTSTVNGTVYSGSGVDLNGNYLVTGDVYFNDTAGPGLDQDGGGEIRGETDDGTYIPALPSVDAQVEAILDTTAGANHNNGTNLIQNDELGLSTGETGTLESGVYHLDSLDVPEDSTLVLETSGGEDGDVVLAVEGNVAVQQGGEIRVEGDGQVRTVVGGESGQQLSLDDANVGVWNGSQYTNRSNGFWFYCKSGCDGSILDGSEFTGVVYGPGDGGGEFGIGRDAEVFGALAVDRIDTTAGNNGVGNTLAELHFDTSVQNAQYDRDGDGVPDEEEDDTDGGVPPEYDDCPESDATGVNGCLPVTEDEDRNALVVNQSHARLTVVGSMVADVRTRTQQVGERAPLDVVFVIDDSGSMAYDDYLGYQETAWIGGDEVWNGEVWEMHDEETGEQQWFTAGEEFDRGKWDYFYRFSPGNDPDGQRELAMQQFVGFLNASNGDRVGVVEFADDDAQVEHGIENGQRFDAANGSLDMHSNGGTPLREAIQSGAEELQDGDNDEKVMVLLTDGQPSYSNDHQVVDAARNVDDGVTIQTVGLGGGTDVGLLEDVAAATGGNYTQVDDSDQLDETFRQIAGNVTEQQYNVVEYKDTVVEVSVNDVPVTLSGNANDPDRTSRPSQVVDIADLNGVDEEQVDQYVGTLLSARATTYACDGVQATGETMTNDGTEYEAVTCNGTAGEFDDVTNDSASSHEIFVDGESVPGASEFEAGWFKDETFLGVLEDYESDTGRELVDDAGDEFTLGENDAVIVVRTNSSNGDTDYVVVHFQAWNSGPWEVNDSDGGGQVVGDGSYDPDVTEDNSYVIDIDQSDVEVGNESARLVPVGGDPQVVSASLVTPVDSGSGGQAIATEPWARGTVRARPSV
ncbi:vWA domain-containing protein [Haloarchaeobius sp. HRN-SO-5]|uniref:vWA domain-containing protein n=1 Tax=Haloarchaeobius sp. HRN-SO-5 TaxID=3446118 RepID=UPI003EB6C20D